MVFLVLVFSVMVVDLVERTFEMSMEIVQKRIKYEFVLEQWTVVVVISVSDLMQNI